MTVEVVMLDRDGALELTERIRVALDRVSTAWADLAERIAEAYERRADLALGYSSWAEYAEAELRPSEGIAADVRRQLVAVLSAQGMSTRAIAPTVGVSQRQISTDVRSDFSPAEPESIDLATGEVLVPPHPQARRAPWPERRDETGGGGVVVIDPKTGEIHQGSDEAVAHITGLAYYLGISSREVAAMAQAGEFGPRGSWPITTTGGRLHAIRIAGWAIDEWISRHQLGGHR